MSSTAKETNQSLLVSLPHALTTAPQVSNVTDTCWLGTEDTLKTFAPLLKRKSHNPHASIVTLYLNAVHEMYRFSDLKFSKMRDSFMAIRYLPQRPHQSGDYDPNYLKFLRALPLVRDMDGLFAIYMASQKFTPLATSLGLEMKNQNTIIKPWPFRLSFNASQEEFERRLASAHTGSERYVEWKRAD